MPGSPPYTYPRLIPPPQPQDYATEDQYRVAYDLWKRTGGINSYVVDLIGLKSTVAELNTLQGIDTATFVQSQLNTKANTADLGSMAVQNKTNVDIRGGKIDSVDISKGTIKDAVLSANTIHNAVELPVSNTGVLAEVGGLLFAGNSIVYYGGIGQADLMTYTVKGNTLVNNKAFLEYAAWGTFATNANTKILRAQFGNSELYNTGGLALNGGSWFVNGKIIRNDVGSEQSILSINSNNALLTSSAVYNLISENCNNDLVLKITAQGSANGDINQSGFIIKWFTGV